MLSDKIKELLVGHYLTKEQIEDFSSRHTVEEFMDYDEKGEKYFDYIKFDGYIQLFLFVELEESGYFDRDDFDQYCIDIERKELEDF